MANAYRTVTPLHFEDLDPHRFEDMIRQLAYGWRSWRYLDATGRLGKDEGVDIRAVEITVEPDTTPPDEVDEEDIPSPVAATTEERIWRIQCKRYKKMGAGLIREIVAEVIPDGAEPPYGLVVAAACDVSANTIAAFRQEAFARGTAEAHLWSKAHLEDMLFSPNNHHLLFAYFGLSLGVRRRSETQRVRGLIALKRKLLRAFKADSIREQLFADVVIRDITKEHHPREIDSPRFGEMRCPPWHLAQVISFHTGGLLVCRRQYDGWVRPDGSWDVLEASASIPGSAVFDYEQALGTQFTPRSTETAVQLVPEDERLIIREVWFLPYESILEVDPIGDTISDVPHLFCSFRGAAGPYRKNPIFLTTGAAPWSGLKQLDAQSRSVLFANPSRRRGRLPADERTKGERYDAVEPPRRNRR